MRGLDMLTVWGCLVLGLALVSVPGQGRLLKALSKTRSILLLFLPFCSHSMFVQSINQWSSSVMQIPYSIAVFSPSSLRESSPMTQPKLQSIIVGCSLLLFLSSRDLSSFTSSSDFPLSHLALLSYRNHQMIALSWLFQWNVLILSLRCTDPHDRF